MENNQKKIFLIAGEVSGDLHGAHLIAAIKRKNENISFSGLGGPKMAEAGMHLYEDMTKLAVVGFVEVLKHYDEFKRIFNLILREIKNKKPDAVILIDYPGFNMRLAKALQKRNIKVIYYISPQVWAWKENRVKQIKKYVDKMLVLFQFERTFYAKRGIDAPFVGHPLIDIINVKKTKEEILKSLDMPAFNMTMGLLPGSREKEIERHLPLMLKTADILSKQFAMLQFLIVKAPNISKKTIENYCKGYDFPYAITEDKVYESIKASDLCMVASGTATLETAILQTPMIVVYKTSFLTWFLAKTFVKIPNIAMVNVVAQNRIVPEFVQRKAKPAAMAQTIKELITNEIKIADMKLALKTVRESLGPGGASEKTATEVLSML